MSRDVELEERLEKTRLELEQSRAECGRLAQIRDDVEAEVRELTASLFQVMITSRECACALYRHVFWPRFKTGFISGDDGVLAVEGGGESRRPIRFRGCATIRSLPLLYYIYIRRLRRRQCYPLHSSCSLLPASASP